jgi:hypothetical protein
MKEFILNNFEGCALLITCFVVSLQWNHDRKQKIKNDRKEFLVGTIKDLDMPLSTRQAAAVEYIDSGFNGVTRDYIIKNRLYVKNPIPEINRN